MLVPAEFTAIPTGASKTPVLLAAVPQLVEKAPGVPLLKLSKTSTSY